LRWEIKELESLFVSLKERLSKRGRWLIPYRESDSGAVVIDWTLKGGYKLHTYDCHTLLSNINELSLGQSTTGFPLEFIPAKAGTEMTALDSVMPVPHRVQDKLRRASRSYLKKSKSQKSLNDQMAEPLNSNLAQRSRGSILD
jgi:hypothetical protein